MACTKAEAVSKVKRRKWILLWSLSFVDFLVVRQGKN